MVICLALFSVFKADQTHILSQAKVLPVITVRVSGEAFFILIDCNCVIDSSL